MSKFFKPHYRIITDKYNGYEAQFRPWWSPIWWQCNGINTRGSIEAARKVCQSHYDEHYPRFFPKLVEHYDPEPVEHYDPETKSQQ